MIWRSLLTDPRVRAANRRRVAYLLAAVVADLALLVLLAGLHLTPATDALWRFDIAWEATAPRTWVFFACLLVVQMVVVHVAFRKMLEGPGVVPLYPRDASEGKRFGVYGGPEIVALTHELADRIGTGRVKRIAVMEQPVPNAFTARVVGLGNVVVLHSNLLQILKADEVKAVIAHELGHVARRDSIVTQFAILPKGVLLIVQVMLAITVLEGIWHSDSVLTFVSRVAFLVLGARLLGLAVGWLRRFANRSSQQAEFLCDAVGAKAVSPEAMIGCLLRLGERGEALSALKNALDPYLRKLGRTPDEDEWMRLLGRLPPVGADEDAARRTAAELLVRDQLAHLRDTLKVPLDDGEIERLAERAGTTLRQEYAEGDEAKEAEKARREQDERLIDWRKFDFDKNDILDREELAALVRKLRKTPDLMLFRRFLSVDPDSESHPPARERLLFLYEQFIERPA